MACDPSSLVVQGRSVLSAYESEDILYGAFPRRQAPIDESISLWDFPAAARRPLKEYGNIGFAWMNALHDLYQLEDQDLLHGDAIEITRLAVGTVDDNHLLIVNKLIADYGFGEEVDLQIGYAAKGDPRIRQSVVSHYPTDASYKGFTFVCSLGQIHILHADGENQGYLDGELLKPLD